MKSYKLMICLVTVLLSYSTEARRAMPAVQRVVHDGIVYTAPHDGSRGGVLVAHNQRTGVKLWEKRVYGVEFGGGEEDIQWILIKSLSVTNNNLMIVNEAEHAFSMELSTRHVTPLSEGMVPFETQSGLNTGSVKPQPEQLEMICVILRLDRRDVERLERSRLLDVHTVLNLLKTDKGLVLAMPRMSSISGQEGVVKSVKEVTFPTELTFSDGRGIDTILDGQILPMSSHFDMREVGVIFQCVAVAQATGKSIRVSANIQYIEDPSWKRHTVSLPNSKGKKIEVGFDQPIFPVYAVQHDGEIVNGETILIGGGIPTIDRKGFVYFLLTGKFAHRPGQGEVRGDIGENSGS